MKFFRTIGLFLKWATILSTWCLIGTVLIQIFSRFFLENTPPWTEEASRLFFIYAISFASGLAMKNNYYVHLDIFYRGFNIKTKRLIDTLVPVLILLLFSITGIYSVKFVILGIPERSPSMGISMAFVFFSMTIMSGFICFYLIHKIRKRIQKLNLWF